VSEDKPDESVRAAIEGSIRCARAVVMVRPARGMITPARSDPRFGPKPLRPLHERSTQDRFSACESWE
jgi:hypothetical protein